MKCIALLLFVAMGAAPLQAKGYYHVHRAHKSPPAPKLTTPSPAPVPTPPAATNQVAAQPYPTTPPVRYVVQRPAAAAKSRSSTNSTAATPAVVRGPADAPHITVLNDDPIVEYQKADAAKGFPEAQYALGVRYLTGNGVEQDETKGKELIKQAADQGSERAREKVHELRSAGKL